jgi:hypothetical protein
MPLPHDRDTGVLLLEPDGTFVVGLCRHGWTGARRLRRRESNCPRILM